jgi:hypothetical protein
VSAYAFSPVPLVVFYQKRLFMILALLKLAVLLPLLILLPLTGILLQGKPLAPYLQSPPLTTPIIHHGFSWGSFLLLSIFVLAALAPFAWHIFSYRFPAGEGRAKRYPFPSWGWLGLALIIFFWPLAWSRLPWFAPWQPYTFVPLWLGYILTVNGLTRRRRGRCPLSDQPFFFLALFPASAAFWWFFEYLNRFVQNWYYFGIDHLSPAGYVLHATLSFSTVLPAVLSTAAYLATFPGLTIPLGHYRPLSPLRSRFWYWLLLLMAGIGLLGIGILPQYLYPLLWIAPLLIIIAVQGIAGQETILAPLQHGDWRPVWLPALAALACGFFWELWNWQSLAHWQYSVSLVQRFHIFEMPLLGYAGYLPFGLECLVMADLLRELLGTSRERSFYYLHAD